MCGPPREGAARKRASQRDWWEREGKHRRSARQTNTTTAERFDVPGEVEPIPRHTEYVPEDNSYAESSSEAFIRAIVRDEMNNKKPMSQTNILLMAAASAIGLKFKDQIGSFLGSVATPSVPPAVPSTLVLSPASSEQPAASPQPSA